MAQVGDNSARPDRIRVNTYEYNLDYPYLMPDATPMLTTKHHNAISKSTIAGTSAGDWTESFSYE